MSRFLSRRVPYLAFLLLVLDANSSLGESASTTQKPGETISITDNFFSDTRKAYQLNGPVKWDSGELQLSPESAIVRVEPMLPVCELKFHFWTVDSENQGPNITRIIVLASNGWEVTIAIVRQSQNHSRYCQVVIGELNRDEQALVSIPPNTFVELRQTSPLALQGELERWSVKYNNGLVTVDCNGQHLGSAYSSAFSSWCHGIAIQQQTGSLNVSKLEIGGKRSGYTETQRVAYEESGRIRNRSETLCAEGNLFAGIDMERTRIPLQAEAFGANDFSLGLVHQWIGQRLDDAGHTEKALEAFQASANTFGASLGRDHPEALVASAQAGLLKISLGQKNQGEKIIRQALEKLLQFAGPGSSRTSVVASFYGSAMVTRAMDAFDKEDYKKYVSCVEERLKAITLHDPSNAWLIQEAKSDFEQAALLLTGDVTQQAKIAGVMKATAMVSENQAKGRNQAAHEQLGNIVKSTQALLEKDHVLTLRAELALAVSLATYGDPGKAISLAEQVVERWRKKGDEYSGELVPAMISLGQIYSSNNRFDEAESLFREAGKICLEANQIDSTTYANCLLERGLNQMRLGNTDSAKLSLTHALKLFSDNSESAGERATVVRSMLADVCRIEGDLDGAQEYCEQQRMLVSQKYGTASSAYLNVLTTEARNLMMANQIPAAKVRLEQALELAATNFGKESEAYRSVLQDLVSTRLWLEDDRQVAQQFLELVDFQQKKRESLFKAYPERLQFDQVIVDRSLLSELLRLTVAKRIDPADAYRRVVGAKGAVTNYQRSLRKASRNANSVELIKELRKVTSQSAKLMSATLNDERLGELDDLLGKRDILEKKLATLVKMPESVSAEDKISQLQRVLPNRAAIVDFIEYERPATFLERLFGMETIDSLLAFVIQKDKQVELIELGDASAVDAALTSWLYAIDFEVTGNFKDASQIASIVDQQGVALRKLIWDPIEKSLQHSEMIIISPDGLLVACPFAALPLDADKGFLIEHKVISYMPAASMLLELERENSDKVRQDPQLLIVDNVDYGLPDVTQGSTDSVPFSQFPKDETNSSGCAGLCLGIGRQR